VRRHGLEEVVVGLRPEDLVVDPEGTLEGVVSLVELVGHEQHVACRLPGGQLVWVRMATNSVPLHTGEHVKLLASGTPHLFDPVSTLRIETA